MSETATMVEPTTAENTKKWYIVKTKSNCEKKVLETLTTKLETSGLKNRFGRVLVPEEQVVEVVNGTAKRSTRKLYQGYVFVEMDFNEAAWHLIKDTPHVQGFIGGTPTKPAPITTREMNTILDRMRATEEAPARKHAFDVGQTIIITSGAFKDFEGTVDDINYNQNKLRVSISIFGRPTPMDVDFSQVAKVE